MSTLENLGSLLDSLQNIASLKKEDFHSKEKSFYEPLKFYFLRGVAIIDTILSQSINQILHHETFQKLEMSWRSLLYLANQIQDTNLVQIRILDISREELSKDLNSALEFDQSEIFKKIYENEFGIAGGIPFGVLIGDYEFGRKVVGNLSQDINFLRLICQIAAVAFCPFITAVSPRFFGYDDFSEMGVGKDIKYIFESSHFQEWRNFRSEEETRFLGLILPNTLVRTPYERRNAEKEDFVFQEEFSSSAQASWGNASYAFASILMRAFVEKGWFSEIRGTFTNMLEGGVVRGLPEDFPGQKDNALVSNCPVNIQVTKKLEGILSELGFISVCPAHYTKFVVFYNCHSVNTEKIYTHREATINSRMSTMLHYILCMSRFVHYIKIIIRNKIGNFTDTEELESYLQKWLKSYTADISHMSESLLATYPLLALCTKKS